MRKDHQFSYVNKDIAVPPWGIGVILIIAVKLKANNHYYSFIHSSNALKGCMRANAGV